VQAACAIGFFILLGGRQPSIASLYFSPVGCVDKRTAPNLEHSVAIPWTATLCATVTKKGANSSGERKKKTNEFTTQPRLGADVQGP
jgi:hypothetical protein